MMQRVPPVGIKEFSRGVDFIIGRYFKTLSTKARDKRGFDGHLFALTFL